MDNTTTLALGAAGLCAGFIDAIAGGGGLVSVPALLWAGLPPHLALGTNKLQSAVGTLMAVQRYHVARLIDWPTMTVAVAATALAGCLGTCAVLWVDNRVLRYVVPWLLLLVAIHVLRRPARGTAPTPPRLSADRFGALAGGVLGFYDGFFGPGTGAFWTAACVHFRGMDLSRATAFTKVVNLTSNVAALVVFSAWGQVDPGSALAMIIGQAIGGRLGAGLAVQHGAPLIRAVFTIVVFALVARLLWQALAG
jgi:uncharacterized membrane protein YfcA